MWSICVQNIKIQIVTFKIIYNTNIGRREAALRRVMAGKGTSYFGCPAETDIACALPPGYQLITTLELFHITFLRCHSVKEEGALSVLGVLHLEIHVSNHQSLKNVALAHTKYTKVCKTEVN